MGLDFQSELMQQLDVRIGGRIGRGQQLVTIENLVRPGEEAERLALTSQAGPSGGEAHSRPWNRDPGYGDQPNEIEDIKRRLLS